MKIASSRLLDYYTETRPSPLHGLGLFAKRDIPERTIWWKAKRSNVMLLNRSQFFTFQASHINETMNNLMNLAQIYGYYSGRLDSIIICLDNARFVNHSFDPNSGAPPSGNPLSSMTLRKIEEGEEITEDYSCYDLCAWSQITCSELFLVDRQPRAVAQ